MTTDKYTAEVNKIVTIIEIAIDAMKKHPPKIFDISHLNQFVSTYTDFKNSAINPEPQYKNLKSLSYIKNDALIYFQEASGEAVNFFWKEIKQKGININRTNKLDKILKKNKISNQAELDYVIDTMIPAHQEGVITHEQLSLLKSLIGKFEDKWSGRT
jgi:hypothetical protein